MSQREVQIDGVTGNPIGGVQSGYSQGSNLQNTAYQVGSSAVGSSQFQNAAYSLGSGAAGSSTYQVSGGAVGATYGSGNYGYQTTTTQYVQPSTSTYTTTQYAQPSTYTYTQAVPTTTTYTQALPTATTYVSGATTIQQQQAQVVNTVVNTAKEVIKG